MRTITALVSAAAAATLLSAPAQAEVHVIELSADAADLTTGSFSIGSSAYRTGQLIMRSFTPFTIRQGDTIRAIVRLNGGLIVPSSMEQLFGLNFFRQDGQEPTIIAGLTTSGTGTFSYSMGATGLPSDVQGGACGNCLTAIMGQVPGAQFIFDGLDVDQEILALGGEYTIDSASFSYQLRDLAMGAIPEPGTWAMMILGFGVIGGGLRRRKYRQRVTFTPAA